MQAQIPRKTPHRLHQGFAKRILSQTGSITNDLEDTVFNLHMGTMHISHLSTVILPVTSLILPQQAQLPRNSIPQLRHSVNTLCTLNHSHDSWHASQQDRWYIIPAPEYERCPSYPRESVVPQPRGLRSTSRCPLAPSRPENLKPIWICDSGLLQSKSGWIHTAL
jgi:hypothetical protein